MSDSQKKHDGIEFYQIEENTAKGFADKCSELMSKNFIFTSHPTLAIDPLNGEKYYTQQWVRKDGEKVQFDVVPE